MAELIIIFMFLNVIRWLMTKITKNPSWPEDNELFVDTNGITKIKR